MRKRIIYSIGVVVMGLAVGWMAFDRVEQITHKTVSAVSVQAVTQSIPVAARPSETTRRSITQAAPSRAGYETLGAGYEITRDTQGRLVSARSKGGTPRARKGSASKRLESEQDFRAEAREWLREMEESDRASEVSWVPSSVKMGPVSGQVVFDQTWEGLPVQPAGVVVVDLTRAAELIAYQRDTSPVERAQGSFTVSAEDAAQAGLQSMTDEAKRGSLQSARPVTERIFWREQGMTSSPIVQAAYRVRGPGLEVVVDATDGKVLNVRNTRQY